MDYEYKDQHFSVEIAETLIPEGYSHGNRLRDLTDRVMESHINRGGLGPPEGENSHEMVQKALQKMSAVAKASEISPNRWRYGHTDQWIFGTGENWIYLYYFPQEKRDAEEKGSSVFPSKIGKADGVSRNGHIKYDAPEKRVESLTRGAREIAKIPLLFRTDSHTTLETAIHKHLELQDKRIRNRPSKEWFLTNPLEVVIIVAEINFDLLRPVYNFSAFFADME